LTGRRSETVRVHPNLRLVDRDDREADDAAAFPGSARFSPDDDDRFEPAPTRRRRSTPARVTAWLLRLVGAGLVVAAGAVLYLAPHHPVATPPAAQPVANASAPVPSSPPASAAPAPATAPPPAPGAEAPPVPSVDVLVMLIRSSLMALQQANVAGNYAVLRELSAPALASASTPAGLSQAFAPLRDGKIDLSAIAVTNPNLVTQPAIGPDGLLHLAGFFPAPQGQIDFSLAYKLVDSHWRMIGMTVTPPSSPSAAPAPKAAPLAAGKVPDDATLITLIRTAVLCLNQANATGDYAVLRESAAAGFQGANSLDKLGSTFATLRARQLDLSPVTVITPRLFKKPAIDESGYLRLTGYFPSRPEQVNFDLAFKFEGGAWRLFGIGVNTSVPAPADAAGNAPER
jgi:hypothetical protein